MLIITSSEFADDFAELIAYRLLNGIRCKVITIEQIDSEMSGIV